MTGVQDENERADNFKQLKISANRTANWKERIAAIEELGEWELDQVLNIHEHRMNNDLVYPVQEAAYRKLQELGHDAELPSRRKGELIKGVSKILLRIKKSLPAGHSFEEFKEKLKKTRLDVYDTYEGDKGADFDQWLKETWVALPVR